MSARWITGLGALLFCLVPTQATETPPSSNAEEPEPSPIAIEALSLCESSLSDVKGCGQLLSAGGKENCEQKNLIVQYHPTALMNKVQLHSDTVASSIFTHITSGVFTKSDIFTIIYGPYSTDVWDSYVDVHVGNVYEVCKRLANRKDRNGDNRSIESLLNLSTGSTETTTRAFSRFTSMSALKAVIKSFYIIKKYSYVKCLVPVQVPVPVPATYNACKFPGHVCDGEENKFEELEFKKVLGYLESLSGKDPSSLVPRKRHPSTTVNYLGQYTIRKLFSRDSNIRKYILVFYDPVADSISYSRLSPRDRCEVSGICYKDKEADELLSEWNTKHSTFIANYPDVLEVKSSWQEDYADGYLRIPSFKFFPLWKKVDVFLKGKHLSYLGGVNLSESAIEVSDPKSDKLELIYYLMELNPAYFFAYGITENNTPIATKGEYYSEVYGFSSKVSIDAGGLNCYSPAVTSEVVYGAGNLLGQSEGASNVNIGLFNSVSPGGQKSGKDTVMNLDDVRLLSKLCSIPMSGSCTSLSCQLWNLSKPRWYINYVTNKSNLSLDSLKVSNMGAVASTIEHHSLGGGDSSPPEYEASVFYPVKRSELSKWASTRIMLVFSSDLSANVDRRKTQLVNIYRFNELLTDINFRPEKFMHDGCRELLDEDTHGEILEGHGAGNRVCARNMDDVISLARQNGDPFRKDSIQKGE